ncbi:MAG: peptidylprolyl isomerase [Acidobacteriota bacterium]
MTSPRLISTALLLALAVASTACAGHAVSSTPAPTASAPAAPAKPAARAMSEILAASAPTDWRPLDPENTLYVELSTGRVVIEMAPVFAPNHVANVRTLVREHYFDGIPFVRAQENYVVQWGDPEEDAAKQKPMHDGKRSLAAEFDRALDPALPFAKLPDGDIYAPEVGHSLGLPVARDAMHGREWLAHCYAMVGAGRGDTSDSGSGAEIYVVIGHAPRHLDRNVTLFGRVVQGMNLLSTLPRGTAAMGFYEQASERTPIRAIRLAADVPVAERTNLEVLRTDTPLWLEMVASRRTRPEGWFLNKAGRIDLCNVPIPVRAAAASPHP